MASSATSACSEPSSTGRWMGFAHDRARTHPCRKGLAEGPVADSSAELPLSAELLSLCHYRARTLWRDQRGLDGPETHWPLPPVGRPGPRPGTLGGSNSSER